uniref:UmuC domain-containing protein n=1 Tax=Clastoptera arizonana TaxID=38151 RepID=A0A1B6CDJ9_9HEMI
MDECEFYDSINKHTRTIIHFDIDCFYAQCEMLKNPELRYKPLGVKQKNYIITSNYVARAYGIRKCMLLKDALLICPHLVIVNGEDLYDYRKMSARVTEIIKQYSNKVEKLGLDENFVDVSELVSFRLEKDSEDKPITFSGQIYKNVMDNKCICGCTKRLKYGSIIANEIRGEIKEILNLTCSAGIGHNKLVAKLVSSIHKPDQQTTILPNAVPILMSTLCSLRAIPGIGKKTSYILNNCNIKTISDIQNCSLHELEKQLGKSVSEWIVKSSFGIDDSIVKTSGKPQTLSIEDAVIKISTITEIEDKFINLIERLLILVREDGRLPTTLKVTLRKVSKYSRVSKQCTVNPNIIKSSASSRTILQMAMGMFESLIDQTKPFHLTLVGIGFTKFKDIYNGKKSIVSFLTDSKSDTPTASVSNTFFSNRKSNLCKPYTEIDSKSITGKFVATDNEVCSRQESFNNVEQPLVTSYEHIFYNLNPENQSSLTLEKTNLSFSSKREGLICPEGVDKDVFSQLPIDIQEELIRVNRTSYQEIQVKKLNSTDHKNNALKKLNSRSKFKNKKSFNQLNKIQNYFSKI